MNGKASLAHQLAATLEARQLRIVFAESCTGGLVSAQMASVPGISRWLCGSAVVYREATKSKWLGIDAEMIQHHSAESPETTALLASAVLRHTPEASVSVAVTGHLGPGSPSEKDGHIFISWKGRDSDLISSGCRSIVLKQTERTARQLEATRAVLETALKAIVDGSIKAS